MYVTHSQYLDNFVISIIIFLSSHCTVCYIFDFTGQQRRRGTRRPRDGPSEVEQTLLELLKRPPAPPLRPPQSADEHFLLSLLPFLQSMPSHTKEIIKFQMYKLAMENSTVVLNLEQSDPHSPQ